MGEPSTPGQFFRRVKIQEVAEIASFDLRTTELIHEQIHFNGKPSLAAAFPVFVQRKRFLISIVKIDGDVILRCDVLEGGEQLCAFDAAVGSHISGNSARALEFEGTHWPAKVLGEKIGSWIVPIQPRWAMQLFETKFAREFLLPPNRELILSRENVYYSGAVQAGMGEAYDTAIASTQKKPGS